MSIKTILTLLRQNASFMQNVVAWERIPPRPARHADPPAAMDSTLVSLMQQQGTWPLYTHQAQAIQAALAGENVVVVTSTASGKTLCYNLPILQTFLHEPSAAALCLFPTKALAQDQLAGLNQLVKGLPKPISVNLYDGDTPAARRSAVRRLGGIVLSNPDMLHAGILPHHTRWVKLFSNLRYVILDEIHTYRGVFGSHLANLLRRLRRICQLYGSDPRFICTSATIANPAEHAQNLIEAPVTLIANHEDGSPRGERHFILYNPPLLDPALGIRQSALRASVQIAGEFLQQKVQTILFARSRLQTELSLAALRDHMAQSLPAEQIQGYRGGYLPQERRSIERGLREGTVRGVTATNALELGVDIGELSACLLMGYPGTIASTRQQAGRVGRRLESSAAVLVASATPLDQYIVTHPRYLFERNPEHALINANNLVILVKHLKCAAFELPFEHDERFGDRPVGEMLAFLADEGFLHPSQRAYHWIADEYPAASISLRSGSSETMVIQDMLGSNGPTVIGEMDRVTAPMLLHEGAIYPHRGQVSVEYFTRASIASTLKILEIEKQAQVGPVSKFHGQVQITSRVSNYRQIKRSTMETLGWGEVDLPPQMLETAAYWLTLDSVLAKQLEAAGILPGHIDYGPNWPQQKRRARERDRRRCQHCNAIRPPARHPSQPALSHFWICARCQRSLFAGQQAGESGHALPRVPSPGGERGPYAQRLGRPGQPIPQPGPALFDVRPA